MNLIWIYLKYYMYICSVRFVSYQETAHKKTVNWL